MELTFVSKHRLMKIIQVYPREDSILRSVELESTLYKDIGLSLSYSPLLSIFSCVLFLFSSIHQIPSHDQLLIL